MLEGAREEAGRGIGGPAEVNPDAVIAEYNSLRAEILKRIEFRHRLNAIALTAAAAFLGVGLTEPTVALVLPLLIALLALSWVHNDLRVGTIAEYIRTHIEVVLPDIQWETRMHKTRVDGPGRRRWRRTVLAQAGVFALIQAVALLIGILGEDESRLTRILIRVDMAMIVVMFAIMSMALYRYRRTRQASGGGI